MLGVWRLANGIAQHTTGRCWDAAGPCTTMEGLSCCDAVASSGASFYGIWSAWRLAFGIAQHTTDFRHFEFTFVVW